MNNKKEEEFLEFFNGEQAKSDTGEHIPEVLDEKSAGIRKHISIKIPQQDLDSIKKEAAKRGLRYQSLINSILHQYVTGRLKST